MYTFIDRLRSQFQDYLAAPVRDKKGIMDAILRPMLQTAELHWSDEHYENIRCVEDIDVQALIEAALSAGMEAGKHDEKIRARIVKAQDDPSWGL